MPNDMESKNEKKNSKNSKLRRIDPRLSDLNKNIFWNKTCLNKSLQAKLKLMLASSKRNVIDVYKNSKDLYIKGSNKLSSEIESCNKIPSEERVFYINHKLDENGEGEPPFEEEIIEIDHQSLF